MATRIASIKETEHAWRAWLNQVQKTANTGLVFERFTEFDAEDHRENPQILRGSMSVDVKQKNYQSYIVIYARADEKLLKAWKLRWLETVKATRAKEFRVSTDWRFIPGFGRKNALEVGLAFHRYGFPYLVGSAVKGLARTAAVIKISEVIHVEKLQKLDDALGVEEEPDRDVVDVIAAELGQKPSEWSVEQKDLVRKFRIVFGTQECAGRAIFFSAVPDAKPEITRDIFTPHFGNYYKGSTNAFPTDGDDPNPIGFLAVASHQPFRFAVGWRGPLDEELQELAVEWLTFGLTQIGAGAKTTNGYGYFQEPQQEIASPETEPKIRDLDVEAKPPQQSVIEIRFGTVSRQQNIKGSVVVLDEKNQHPIAIPQHMFAGNSPPQKARVEITFTDGIITGARKVR